MKRTLFVLAGTCLFLLGVGCASRYDYRMGKMYDKMKHQLQLDKNLEAADAKTELAQSNIFVRPPLGFQGPSKEFGLPIVAADKFDARATFFGDQGSLHIVARVPQPKAAPTKKGAKPPPARAPRGDFTVDVLALLSNAYGANFKKSDLKSDPKTDGEKTNNFKALSKTLEDGKWINAYLIGEKNDPSQVALIFESPSKAEFDKVSSKANYCLQSFRRGEGARRLYQGLEEESGEGPAVEVPTGAF